MEKQFTQDHNEIGKWVSKAEVDYEAMLHLAINKPFFNSVICFHAQQCAEKYLKAILISFDITPEKTHDIGKIITLLNSNNSNEDFTHLKKYLFLTDYAVFIRYPGNWDDPDEQETEEAMQACSEVRTFAQNYLKL